MYDPVHRLGRFVDDAGTDIPTVGVHSVEASETCKQVKTRNERKQKSKIDVLVHVVTFEQLLAELAAEPSLLTVNKACRILATKTAMTALGTAKNLAQASKLAATFGDGNLLLYMLATTNTSVPKYLAVGLTTGCTHEDVQLCGTWNVLSACLVSQSGVHAMPDLHWDLAASSTLHSRTCFIRQYHPRLWKVYAEIVHERSLGSTSRDIIARDPAARRPIVLIEALFSTSDRSKQAFFASAGAR